MAKPLHFLVKQSLLSRTSLFFYKKKKLKKKTDFYRKLKKKIQKKFVSDIYTYTWKRI